MVRNDTFRDFDVAVIGHVAGRGLQEEERLLGYRVVQLLDVVRVITTNRNDLWRPVSESSAPAEPSCAVDLPSCRA